MKLLDCTLRDGAHVNAGHFSSNDISMLNSSFGKANVDFVELGFLEKNSDVLATSYYSSIEKLDQVIDRCGHENSKYGFLMRPDRCELDTLTVSQKLSFVRIAFYEEHIKDLEKYIKKSQDLGYIVSLNPIGITTLTRDTLQKILYLCNSFSLNIFSIVDTHGALRIPEFSDLLDFVRQELDTTINIGLHFHENLSLSQALLATALSKPGVKERLIVDSSVTGMGRIPGNLPTELVIENFRNEFSTFKDPEPIYDVIPILLKKFYSSNPWGYNYLFGKAANLNVNRSFPEYYIQKNAEELEILRILNKIADTKKGARFDENLADQYLRDSE